MRIGLVGVFTPNSTNTPMAESLAGLGHEILGVPYREILSRDGLPRLHDVLIETGKQVDAMVVCKGCGAGLPSIEPAVLRDVKALTIFWMPDSVEVVGRGITQLAAACNAACATSLVSCQAFKEDGCAEVHQVFEGFDEKVWKPRGLTKQYDLTFIGTPDGGRAEKLAKLREAGLRVHTPKDVWTVEASKVYNQSQIGLNFVRGEIFSDRVFHILASGSFLLTGACRDLLALSMQSESGSLGFSVFPEGDMLNMIVGACDWLRRDKDREAAVQHNAKVIGRYSWRSQMAKLVRAINGEKIRDGAFN